MLKNTIIVKGARTHNLKNINVEIPRDKIVVFTGVSGSGKSSLVFDTIYTESQRQLIETFSSFARKRLPKLSRPPVDAIRNISTAIIIDQKRMGRNLRSTVGTATEIYTYLRLLFSRFAKPFIGWSNFFSFNRPEGMCPDCRGLGKKITIDTNLLLDYSKSINEGGITHPDYKVNGWNWKEMTGSGLFNNEKKLCDFLDKEINRLLYADSIPIPHKNRVLIYRKNYEGIIRRLERLYITKGEDEENKQNAYTKYFIYSVCQTCCGTRINENARTAALDGVTIPYLVNLVLTDLDNYLKTLTIQEAEPIIKKMRQSLGNLIEIGVGYLSLNRAVSTLSGGESQRVKMARQLDCDLINMTYILDEPSIGLHPSDNNKLIKILYKLRDKGNSVLVVEHDPDIIKAAEWIIDIGPKAGTNGGNILFNGTFHDLCSSSTPTGKLLGQTNTVNSYIRKKWTSYFTIENANMHNLKNISVKIPKNILTCITGVAGSGKSTLINDVFLKQISDAVVIDQTQVGKTSRSNPATYIGIFNIIRKKFANATSTDTSLFSFNSKGACAECKGKGYINMDMSFLDNVKMTCGECNGKRYKDEVLKLKFKNKNIAEILDLTINEAYHFFNSRDILKKLKVLKEIGLGYLKLGQPLSTLSGGESQRLKLAVELHKKGNIYVMDEPTTGLHLADINRLLRIIKKLTDHDNTVIIIEHNLDIIRYADWIIDMGPQGGKNGGEIIAQGKPEDICNVEISLTGKFLKKYFYNTFPTLSV